jgi:hypothetical protein
MRFRACRRSAVVLILLTFFAPVVLRAAPARGGEPAVAERAGGGFFELVRSALSAVWETATLKGDNGSIADPSGDQANGDNGSIFDPSGRS